MNNYQRKRKVQRMLEREKDKLKMSSAEIAVNSLSVITAYVLHTKFGFGKIRISRFLNEFYRIFHDVTSGKVNLKTIAYAVEDFGFNYDCDEMTWTEIERKESGKNEKIC